MANDCGISSGTVNLLVQVTAIVIGWIVVHKLSAARDRDKARREMLAKAADGLSDDVGKLLITARDYHTQARDRRIEDQIKMTLQDISIRTSTLYQISTDTKELAACRSSILSMKKAISFVHFEDEHTVPIELASPQVQSIVADALRVKQNFLKLKHCQFPAE